MTRTIALADGLWLAIAGPVRAGRLDRSRPRGRARRRADRAAARSAREAALRASCLTCSRAAVSLSHSEGVGAALVGKRGRPLGVDVVRIDRVGARHARAILDAYERRALHSESRIRPALAWALKEAAAKATGEPLRDFPSRLRIVRTKDGVHVRAAGTRAALQSGWRVFGRYLFAWVAS